MATVKSKGKKKTKRGSWVKKTFRFFFRCIIVFLIASVLQVLLFKWVPPLFTPIMFFDKISTYAVGSQRFDLKYKWRSMDEISPYMPLAVIAAEDQRFPDHFGLDLKAIEEAIKDNKKGKRVRGGSTITQQVAKNLFLWPSRDYFRKGLEAYYTLLIELLWSKQRIVEVYVNIAEMGYGVYGIEAASEVFFKKEAKKITKIEAALIAAVLPNPKKFSAKNPSAYIQGRKSWIVRQMNQLGGVGFLEKLD